LRSVVKRLSLNLQNSTRMTGIVLVSSFLFPLLALVILVASGAFPAFLAGLQGSLVEKAPYVAIFRTLNLFWIAGWIVQLMGFGMLARLLVLTGDELILIPAFIAILIAAILGILHGTFHMSVESWASLEAVRTGNIPQAYEPLRIWIGSSFQIAYLLHLLGTAGFGWGFLSGGRDHPMIGRISIGWAFLWLMGYFTGAGAPGLLFIMPAVIGAAFLMKPSQGDCI
jgi:hypothetical protein